MPSELLSENVVPTKSVSRDVPCKLTTRTNPPKNVVALPVDISTVLPELADTKYPPLKELLTPLIRRSFVAFPSHHRLMKWLRRQTSESMSTPISQASNVPPMKTFPLAFLSVQPLPLNPSARQFMNVQLAV